MEQTWASGAVELLWHALSHMDFDSEFDSRMAFVSIDNAVELTLRTYVAMPPRFFPENAAPAADEVRRASRSFALLVELVSKSAGPAVAEIDFDKILFYHHVRNRLYHEGVGTTPSAKAAQDYLELAEKLLMVLLRVRLRRDSEQLRLLRQDVIFAVDTEFKAEMRSRRQSAIVTAIDRLSKEGKIFGRESKKLSAEELALAVRLNSTEGWGSERIAARINLERGALTLTDPDARRRASISPRIVLRHLKAHGGYRPGRAPGATKKESLGES